MGLAAGIRAGTLFGQTIKSNYEKGKEEDIQGTLFKAYSDLQQDSQILDEEGNQITQAATDFAGMSGDEITNSMLRQVTQSGGKIDDQTYQIAYQMGNMFQENKDKVSLFQQKQQNLQLRGANLQNTMFNRDRAEARRQERFRLQKEGKYNPSGKKTTTADKPTTLMKNDKYLESKHGKEFAKSYLTKSNSRSGGDSIFDEPEETKETKAPQTKKFRNKKTGNIDTFELKDGKYVKIN